MSAGTRAGGGSGTLPPAGFLLLAGISLFWGVNWPIMKLVLSEVPVWSFRALCLLFGGIGLLVAARLGRQSLRVPLGDLRPLLVCALFNVVGWHVLTAYGIGLIAAGRASIIAFTMPLWAVLLGRLLLGEALSPAKLIGLLLGMAGMAVLIGPELQALGAAPLGAAFMLGAALCWALGTVLMKRHAWSLTAAPLAGWQLLIGSLPVTLGALLEGLPDPGAISTTAYVALVYVLFLPMIFCQWAWFQVVRLFPAAIAALGTLTIPVLGVLSSALLLGEPVGWREALALLLVCSSLAAVLVLPAWRARRV